MNHRRIHKPVHHIAVAMALAVPVLVGVANAETHQGQDDQKAANPSSAQSQSTGGQQHSATDKKAVDPTDLTGGKSGLSKEYTDPAVAHGKLIDVQDDKNLGREVVDAQGKMVGVISRLMKQEGSDDIAYAVVDFKEEDYFIPLRWSKFKEKNGKLEVTLRDSQLKRATAMTSPEDNSPELDHYMKDVERVRNEFKGKAAGSTVLPHGQTPAQSGANTNPAH